MYIARQPIFRRDLEVYGYELLYRGAIDSQVFDGVTGEEATTSVLTGLFEQGADVIAEEKPAFINFGDSIVTTELSKAFKPSELVIEVLENIDATEEVMYKLRELHKQGFKIALDDYVGDLNDELIEIADIIKFDIRLTPLESLKYKIRRAKQLHKYILAEKVETEEEFLKAREMGFDFFQGYFFSKPRIVGGRTVDLRSTTAVYYRVLKELSADEPSFKSIAEHIRLNVELNYKLLRIISKRSSVTADVTTVQRALAYLGLKEVERWINILMLSDVGKSKPVELFKLALTRSLIAEKLAQEIDKLKRYKHEAAMAGLFSVLDALSDMPMENCLSEVMLPDIVNEALLNNTGPIAPIMDLIYSYETADWDSVYNNADILGMDVGNIPKIYYAAVMMAREISLDMSLK